ncbi:hypothetical protein C2W62_42210 [Candidatus Entotheonella serta]|nr:hypothetical protein C2W62_42210 [Candidatus Entotheonella serta]
MQPIAFLNHFGHVAVSLRRLGPEKIRLWRPMFRRAHIGPNDAAGLDCRIGLRSDFMFEIVFCRLIHHVDTMTLDVEFPAMVNTT